MNHLVSAAYIDLILRSQWLPVDQLCRGTSFEDGRLGAREYIPATEVAILFENLDALLPRPTWPVELGGLLGLTSHGPLGFAALSAPTLGEAITTFEQFHSVRVSGLDMALQTTPERCFLVITDSINRPTVAFRMEQLVVKIIESLLETLLGHPVGNNVDILFKQSPPVYAEPLANAYHGRVLFDQPYTAVSLPISWMSLPSPLFDENNYRQQCTQCRIVMNRILDPSDILGKVTRLLDNHFDNALQQHSSLALTPSLETIAAQLCMSPRTLIRHLKKHNTHFRALIDDRRFSAAQALLKRPGLSVSDIAFRLGYKEAANFARAFKVWAGCSPSQWRQKLT